MRRHQLSLLLVFTLAAWSPGQDRDPREVLPQPENEPPFDRTEDPEFDPRVGVDGIPVPTLTHTRAFLETAGFEDLKSVFEQVRSGKVEPNDDVDRTTLCRALLRSEDFAGERYIQQQFSAFNEDEKIQLAPMLGHFGRSLGTFMTLIEEIPTAEGYKEALFAAQANLFAKRMKDDEQWQGSLAFDLNRFNDEEVEYAAYFIAKAGGEVSKVLLAEALATRDSAKLVPVLRAIAGLPFTGETIEKVGALLADPREDIGVRMACISALRRCELRGLPQLIAAYERLAAEEPSEQNAALRKFIRDAMIKITRGVDYGESAAAWKTHLESGPIPLDVEIPTETVEAAPESGLHPALVSATVAFLLTLMCLGAIGLKRAIGPALILFPLAIGFVIASVVQMIPAAEVEEEVTELVPTDMTPAVASKLGQQIWDHLQLQAKNGPTRPPFAALRGSERLLSGEAFEPLVQRLDEARRFEVLRVHKRLAKGYLILDNGKILTARIDFQMQEGTPRVTDFKASLLLSGSSAPRAAAPTTPGEQAEAGKRTLANGFAVLLCLLSIGGLATTFYLGSRLRPWERDGLGSGLFDSAPAEKVDRTKANLENAMRSIGLNIEAEKGEGGAAAGADGARAEGSPEASTQERQGPAA